MSKSVVFVSEALSYVHPLQILLFDLSTSPLILQPLFSCCPPSDTPGSHSHLKYHHPSNLSFIFLPPIFPSLPNSAFTNSGNSCSDSQLWSRSGPISPCPLTLHIYTDGLDGSHPHPVVGLAVVATPLHPLDALDAERLIVDGCFLELV